MVNCSHHVCGKEERIWLPTSDMRYGSLEKHPWCKTCGLVKNISDDRPKKIGYWMNLFSYLSSEIALTQVQKRLISKELKDTEIFHDMFGSFGSDQKDIFLRILTKYVSLESLDIETLFG
jgi:hypothetical protein